MSLLLMLVLAACSGQSAEIDTSSEMSTQDDISHDDTFQESQEAETIQEGPVVIDMRDYGNMEKVGGIGKSLPTNNEQITTEAGDLILYQGNALVIYYDTNSWNFTRLGKIQGVTASELKEILGNGNVTVTLTME